MKGIIKSLIYFYVFSLMIFSIGALIKCVIEDKDRLQCPYLRKEIGDLGRLLRVDAFFSDFFGYLDIFDKNLLNILAFNGYISTLAFILSGIYLLLSTLHRGIGMALKLVLLIVFVTMLFAMLQKMSVSQSYGLSTMSFQQVVDNCKRMVNYALGV